MVPNDISFLLVMASDIDALVKFFRHIVHGVLTMIWWLYETVCAMPYIAGATNCPVRLPPKNGFIHSHAGKAKSQDAVNS
jgi:hypothetical protein